MGHHKVIEKRYDKVMERSMTRLWEEAWQGHGKKHDKVMGRSMTSTWQEVWSDHEKKCDHIMEESLAYPNKVMEMMSKKYIKART